MIPRSWAGPKKVGPAQILLGFGCSGWWAANPPRLLCGLLMLNSRLEGFSDIGYTDGLPSNHPGNTADDALNMQLSLGGAGRGCPY